MAAPASPLCAAPLLSRKQRKSALRKERRKRKRQFVAQARDGGLINGESHTPEEEEEEEAEDDNNDVNEEESRQKHEEWLERERLAQEEFRLRFEREEAAREKKEEEERLIKEEWEAQQTKEREEKEQKQQEKRDREEAVQKMLDEAENQLENPGPWMNPEAPATESSDNYGTERDVANCPFFLKTGACRFGDRCSRKHQHPSSSPTLMVRGMFITYGMEQARRDDYDMDACLEHSEEELQETFVDFYHDVLPEFRSVGRVVQFKVSCNHEPHLRGNVYIQFDTEQQCKEAFIKFNGRWYAGKQLHCEICPVTRWKNAICGLFDRQKCPKGKHCNFLHVFRNPGNEFWEADRDLHLSPERGSWGSQRDSWRSERSWRQQWRGGGSSRSPPRSERAYDRRRSGSRERRREDRRVCAGRYSDRGRDRYRSRSRSRSGSRDRATHRSNGRKQRQDEERGAGERRSGSKGRDGEASRGQKRSKKRSADKLEDEEKSPGGDSKRGRCHKRSKKSKKKSKKKHKKRSRSPDGTSSSRESEGETVETVETQEAELQKSCLVGRESPELQKNSSPDVKSDELKAEIEVMPQGTDDISASETLQL